MARGGGGGRAVGGMTRPMPRSAPSPAMRQNVGAINRSPAQPNRNLGVPNRVGGANEINRVNVNRGNFNNINRVGGNGYYGGMNTVVHHNNGWGGSAYGRGNNFGSPYYG